MSFEAGLDEANHPVHQLEQFGSARGSCQGLGFIALVELTQTGDGRQRGEARSERQNQFRLIDRTLNGRMRIRN